MIVYKLFPRWTPAASWDWIHAFRNAPAEAACWRWLVAAGARPESQITPFGVVESPLRLLGHGPLPRRFAVSGRPFLLVMAADHVAGLGAYAADPAYNYRYLALSGTTA